MLAAFVQALLLALIAPPLGVVVVASLAQLHVIPRIVAEFLLSPVRTLHQPPRWIRYVVGSDFSVSLFVVWLWIAGPAVLVGRGLRRVIAYVCGWRGHVFDQTYGSDGEGNPVRYCSRCYRWELGRGFME